MHEDELRDRRRWYEEGYSHLYDSEKVAVGLFTCPCCGYPTLSGREDYEICILCSWEDDGQDDENANEVRGVPNGLFSLSQARFNFHEHLCMYPPDQDTRIGGHDTSDVIIAKEKIIMAFEEMRIASSAQRMKQLSRIVDAYSVVLHQLSASKIRSQERSTLKDYPPCPKCELPLRSSKAKQCFICGEDWH
jgi:hypothetical protein